MSIETSSYALSLHEIAHIRQSLDIGGLRFVNGRLANPGGTVPGSQIEKYKAISYNEVEAYKIQYSMDGSFPGNLNGNGLNGIDVHSVGEINNGKTYKEINRYSEYIKQLEFITIK